MNFTSSINQIYLYIIFSIFISVSVNLIRDDSLSYFAEELKKVYNINEIKEKISDFKIREIDIGIAKNLFENNILFIDARAEEYYKEGHIPSALCNDDIEKLINEIEKKISFDDGFVVYCSDDDCGSSEELAIYLQEQGFMNIFLFKGGWKQWKENNLPVNSK